MTDTKTIIWIYQDVLDGKRCRFPNHFFIGTQGKIALAILTRYLIEEVLRIPVARIPQLIRADTLWTHRLNPGAKAQGWNFFDLIENAYPGKFHPWEFKQVPHGYWQGEKGRQRAIEAIRTVIENQCQIPHAEIPRRINAQFFIDHRIQGLFALFCQSPYEVIQALYPDEFQPWECENVPLNYWKDPDNVKQVMDMFLFEELGFSSYREALWKLRKQDFIDHRMTGLLQMGFDRKMQTVKAWLKRQISEREETLGLNFSPDPPTIKTGHATHPHDTTHVLHKAR